MCLKVWSRQRHDLPTPGVPSNAAAGDVNPKISNRIRGQTVKPMIQFLPPPLGIIKKKRWAVGGQYAHEIKKKKMGIRKKKKGGENAHLFYAFFWCPSFGQP